MPPPNEPSGQFQLSLGVLLVDPISGQLVTDGAVQSGQQKPAGVLVPLQSHRPCGRAERGIRPPGTS